MKYVLLILAFTACTSKPTPMEAPAPIVDKPIEQPVVVDKPVVESTVPLSWEKGHPERKAWSDQTRLTVGVVLRDLDKAKDASRFCPKYASLGAFDRVSFWSELVSVMASFESGWNPATVYKEPAPLNNESLGLLQLSTSDAKNYSSISQCQGVATKAGALDPLKSLDCGIRILAHWIAKDGRIGSDSPYSGGAKYWSVLREKRKLPEVLAKLKSLAICR